MGDAEEDKRQKPGGEADHQATQPQGQSDASIARTVSELLARTIDSLEVSSAHDEALAIRKPARGFSLFKSPATMVPVGRAWRLGVLLLDRDGHLYATGDVTRAVEPLRGVTNRSQAAELRRDDRRAASRGPFARGEVVNFGFSAIALDADSLRAGSGPLSVSGNTVMVRWDTGTAGPGISRLDSYLTDRAALLTMD